MKTIGFLLRVEIPNAAIKALVTDDAIMGPPALRDVAAIVRDELQRQLSETLGNVAVTIEECPSETKGGKR